MNTLIFIILKMDPEAKTLPLSSCMHPNPQAKSLPPVSSFLHPNRWIAHIEHKYSQPEQLKIEGQRSVFTLLALIIVEVTIFVFQNPKPVENVSRIPNW
jgi:hypothetical protein